MHKDIGKCSFRAVTNRLAFIDVKAAGRSARLIAVYMPDSSHPECEVEEVYAQLDAILEDARRRGIAPVVAGDLNAEVGQRDEYDDPAILGPCTTTNRMREASP